jgi:hypothetical protein
VFTGEPAAFQPAVAIEGDGFSGAQFRGWTVVVVMPGRPAGLPVTYLSRAAGKQVQLLMGLSPSQGVQVLLGGKEILRTRSSENGSVVFETEQEPGTVLEVTVQPR